MDDNVRQRIETLKEQLDGLDVEGPTYEQLLGFVTDCARTPIEGDFEQDGQWSESQGLDPGAVDYVTTVEWARTLIRITSLTFVVGSRRTSEYVGHAL